MATTTTTTAPEFVGEGATTIVRDARAALAAIRKAEGTIVTSTRKIGECFVRATRSGMVARVGEDAPTRITLRSFATLVLGDEGSRMTVQRGRALAVLNEARPDLANPSVREAGRVPADAFTDDHRLTDKAIEGLAGVPANATFTDAVKAIRAALGKGEGAQAGGGNAGGGEGEGEGGKPAGAPDNASATRVADSIVALLGAFGPRIGKAGWSFHEVTDALARIHDAFGHAERALSDALEADGKGDDA